MNKELKKNTEVAAEAAMKDEILGKNLKSKSELRIEQGIVCTINQFLTFGLDLSLGEKTKIVKGQQADKKSEDYAPWFTRASGPIRKSFEVNERSPIYYKLSELKDFKFDDSKRNERADVIGSIDALNKFLSLKLPEPFNHVKKVKVPVRNKFVTINGVKIKVTPDLVFETKIDGKICVGAVRILIRKGKPLGLRQLKMGAHILQQYLEDSKADFQGEVKRELCVYIDVFHESVVIAPDKASVPQTELSKVSREYSDLWVKLMNQPKN